MPERPPEVLARRAAVIALSAVLVVALSPGISFGQAQFGKNKVHYRTFDWHVYRSPHFDVYYYPEGEPFLEQVVSYAESAYLYLSQALDHEPKFRVPVIYYRTHAEFEQTNILLSSLPEGYLAFAEPLEHRVALSIDHPLDELYELIVHELTHIFEYSILFQDSLGRAVRGRPPGWLMEGLASYLAKDEDNIDQLVVRDAVINGLVPPITRVTGVSFLTYRYGHAAFDFIESEWGAEGLRTFLSEYRRVLLTSNIEKSIKEAFGIDAEEFDRLFKRYLRKKYLPTLLEKGEPEDYGKEIGIKLPGVVTVSPVLSPSGDLVAVLTNRYNDLDVVVLSAKDGEVIKNLTRGFTNAYEYVSSMAFQGMADLTWSPDGDRVAVFVRKEDRRLLLIADALTGRQVALLEVNAANAASPAFSPDGRTMLFSGNVDGIVDIFELDLETGESRNITNDEYHDSNPSWSADGTTILYNRRVDAYEKIFLLDYEDPSRKTQVTFGPTSDITPAFSRDGKKVYYSSDAGKEGIFNLYSLDLDSGVVKKYTDVAGGIFQPQDRPAQEGKDTVVATTFSKGRFRLFEVDVTKPLEVISPEERAEQITDLEPFEAPLKLTVDEEEKAPLKKRTYHIETVPQVGIGVANDGTIYGDAFLLFSDLLGDRRFWVNVTSVANYQNFDVGYVNLESRLHYNFRIIDYRDFVLYGTTSGELDRVRANRVTGGSAGLSYPLSKNYRVEASLGVYGRDVLDTGLVHLDDPNTPNAADFGFLTNDTLKTTDAILSGSLVGDTVRYNPWGPWHGKRFNFTVAGAPFTSGDEEGNFVNYSLDFRAYGKVTTRSLFAFRLSSIVSTGPGARLFGLGGINQLRGYDFREFIGDRAAWMNLEFRFPLVDELRLPFGSLHWFRGLIFLDVGAAWTQDNYFFDREYGDIGLIYLLGQPGVFREFKFWNSDENMLQDGRASYGLGFSLRLGIFDLTWAFAKKIKHLETAESTCRDDVNAAYRLIDPNNPALGRTIDLDMLASGLSSCEFKKVATSGWSSAFYIGTQF